MQPIANPPCANCERHGFEHGCMLADRTGVIFCSEDCGWSYQLRATAPQHAPASAALPPRQESVGNILSRSVSASRPTPTPRNGRVFGNSGRRNAQFAPNVQQTSPVSSIEGEQEAETRLQTRPVSSSKPPLNSPRGIIPFTSSYNAMFEFHASQLHFRI